MAQTEAYGRSDEKPYQNPVTLMEAYYKHGNWRDVGEEFGVSKDTVFRAARKLGIEEKAERYRLKYCEECGELEWFNPSSVLLEDSLVCESCAETKS